VFEVMSKVKVESYSDGRVSEVFQQYLSELVRLDRMIVDNTISIQDLVILRNFD
jgi:hypothetical protein